MGERRKKLRFELRLRCVIVHPLSGLRTNGETRNVSSSGVLFISERPVPVGALIDCLISFPRFRRARRDVQLRCEGTVLREDANLTFAASLHRYELVRLKRSRVKNLTD